MNTLYAPWRSPYATQDGKKNPTKCVFCSLGHDTTRDKENFILWRGRYTFTMLNLYPYNGGHLLIAPYAHMDSLTQLNEGARCELMEAANKGVRLLSKSVHPDGFNIGMNMGGNAAGGSIPEHIHLHVLPRYKSDTSFLVTLADTKPVSEDLARLYTCLTAVLATGDL